MLEWVLATFVKGMKIRLRKSRLSVLAEWKAPRRRNCRWCDEFMINSDGYWLYCVWHGLFKQNLWISEHAWHFKSQMACGSLVSITWSGIGNGIGVAGCYWGGFGTCGIGWGWVWLGGWGQEVGHVIHGTNPYTCIISNHKFTIPSSISTLGYFSLSQNGQPILAQPKFHTLNKSGQYSPKHKLFSDLLVSYDRWDL